MRVAITGAAGFLGSHLAERLVREGHEVIGLDNLSTSSGENLDAIRERSNFSFVEADVTRDFPIDGKLNLVFHFASPASPKGYAALPLETLAVNSLGTRRACESALRHGARLLYASTSEVYGDPQVHPQPESYWGNVNPVGERSCYDEGKRFGEATIAAYRRAHGLDARMVRIFNTYGPRMHPRDGRVVPQFIGQALAGEPLTIYGDGKQTRCLCYVEDLIEGVVRLAMLAAPKAWIVNIGSDRELSVNEIATAIARLCGVAFEKTTRPLPPDDPVRRRPDLQLAREVLQWTPCTSLEDGMRATIEWFRARMSIV